MMVDFILCSSSIVGLCASLKSLVQDMLSEDIELGWVGKNLLDELKKIIILKTVY